MAGGLDRVTRRDRARRVHAAGGVGAVAGPDDAAAAGLLVGRLLRGAGRVVEQHGAASMAPGGGACAASGVGIAAGQPALAASACRRRPDLRLTMFDVGQGESLLVESGGWRALIDTGGRPFGDGADIGRARRGAGVLGAGRDVARRPADHPRRPGPCGRRRRRDRRAGRAGAVAGRGGSGPRASQALLRRAAAEAARA